VIERHSHSRVEYMVKVGSFYRTPLIMGFIFLAFQAKSQFKRRSTANNVEIIIPVPNDADTPKFKTTVGHVRYVPEDNAAVWTIRSFPVRYTFLLTPSFSAVSFLLSYLSFS
jgi:Adaptor complexes medium subunit family